MSLLFIKLNGTFPGPSIFVLNGKIGSPHAILPLNYLL
jgi:hypothetical protein